MKKRTTSSTKLKTAPPPLNKSRAGINQAYFRVGNRVEVAWGIGPNQARKTYQKLYNREAYNAKARAALEKKHAGKRKSDEENGKEYRPGKKKMKGDFVITDWALAASVFTLYYFSSSNSLTRGEKHPLQCSRTLNASREGRPR